MAVAPPPSPAPRILYVDDDVALGRLVARDLERNGFAVTSATDAAKAMELLRASEFDLVVLDHYMPGQDGLDTLAQIQSEIPVAPPVVYLTGSQESRVAVAALKAGAADYMIKSAEGDFLDLLRTAIHQAIEQTTLRRERAAARIAIEAANRRLETLVERQAVLLREMNHRIANSLALVGSLVRLQMSAISDGAARSALADTQHRLAAIMQVHRRLYTSADVEKTDLSAYLRGLLAELERSLSGTGGHHRLSLETVPVVLATDRVVPVGVIVTELVTNALKYAYPDGHGPGEIRIRLRRAESCDDLVLSVEDDGVGLGDDEAAAGTGLGRRVIEAMAVSLEARIEIDNGHRGTRITLTFPP
ncbi:MAG: response regulator [Alphaproteobacteria bacterium]|nr:response regulator [Alphaproteobacteria bacterium]